MRLYPTESRTKESRSTYYSGLLITLCGKVTLSESEERGARAMPISNAHELFVHKLGTICDAEHQFVEGQQEEQTDGTDPRAERPRIAAEDHLSIYWYTTE